MISVSSGYIPTCLEYLPPVYADIAEFKQLARTYNEEMILLNNQLNEIYNNYHIDTLNEYGCMRWEKILKIKVNSNYTIEDRRFNIKVRLLGFLPYTYLRLEDILKMLVGEGNYLLDLNFNINHLNCKLDLGIKNQLDATKDMLEKVVPLNISLNVELLYNTHLILSRFTHEYLSQFTHYDLRETKMPD